MSSISAGSISSSSGSPLSVTGLATGLNTSAIIAALMAAERQPVTRLGTQQEKLTAGQQQLQGIQRNLRQLATAASEFSLPSLFESAQTVSSSEPTRIAAATTSGAGVGGYEVEVKRLASSAQRTFAFTTPAAEDAITIDGLEYKLAAGASANTLAEKINSDSKGTVYAAVVEGNTIALSTRGTGATGPEFIRVTDPGGVLAEKPGTAREGFDAEFSVDGTEGKSTSNTVTNAIAGVTLSLLAPTTAGPVTISVQPPGPSVSAIEGQLKSFITTYNSTIEAIHQQLTTKPPAHPTEAREFATGTLFGDRELSSLLDSMRQAMYEPLAGLPVAMASPSAVGISTGAATAGGGAPGSIEGLLKLDPAKLANAVQSNAAGVEKMLQQWSAGLQKTIDGVAQAGGPLEARITSDSTQISELRTRIASMNEILLTREKSLQATYAELEGVLSQNLAQSNWLVSQSESLTKSGL